MEFESAQDAAAAIDNMNLSELFGKGRVGIESIVSCNLLKASYK